MENQSDIDCEDDDDIQIENQSDIDCEDDDEDVLECIYQNDVSINFIIVEYTSFFLFLFNHSDANSISSSSSNY
jgi:hypothetical protein